MNLKSVLYSFLSPEHLSSLLCEPLPLGIIPSFRLVWPWKSFVQGGILGWLGTVFLTFNVAENGASLLQLVAHPLE